MNERLAAALVPIVSMLIPISGIAMVVLIVWFGERRKERQSFQRTELLKRIAESQGDAAQKVLEMMREEERGAQIRRSEGMKLGGLVVLAIGIALMPMLAMLAPSEPVWLVGLIPALVGAALLIYVIFLAPKAKKEYPESPKAL
jgi:hypothetical protein